MKCDNPYDSYVVEEEVVEAESVERKGSKIEAALGMLACAPAIFVAIIIFLFVLWWTKDRSQEEAQAVFGIILKWCVLIWLFSWVVFYFVWMIPILSTDFNKWVAP